MTGTKTDGDKDLKEKLQALSLKFAATAGRRVAEIETAARRIIEAKEGCNISKVMDETAFLAHRLAGSAASFGFPSLGGTAAALEKLLNSIKSATAVSNEQARLIKALIGDLGKNLNKEKPSPPASLSPSPAAIANAEAETEKQRLVFLIEDDKDMAADMAAQLGHFGYEARVFHSAEGVIEALIKTLPAAVIANVTLPEGELAGIELLANIRDATPSPPPTIAISTRDDLPARLAAVRAGARGYYSKPVDVARLSEALDAETEEEEAEPYRVLIVDDDESMAELYAMFLQSSGIATKTVTKPLDVMGPLAEYHPDLLLMDINMPDCNGIELASVIRQKEDYVRIPIVFLTSETNQNHRILAMQTGADDFLQKPVPPELLLSSVQSRIERSRFFDSMITRDSMTGLINHSKIKEILGVEINRAARQGAPLSFAMIDLDKFKSINDACGHWAGDMVIKALALVLRQRLRKPDVVGRYGGEEFSVILPDTGSGSAAAVLDEIREGFSLIKHQVKGNGIQATFSCGIAAAEPGDSVETLTIKADEALYKAKQTGRNRVVLAGD
ncbi:MAG TPA: diguanylate cyclase [Alphaproteobacteria bacterium]|nr:diguanylate cyclase [Alphaproteobacteria bacterium]